MLIAGIGLVLAGLLAIGVGIPIKEFSFGSTLILAGVTGVCTGAIMLALWTAVRELKIIAQRLGLARLSCLGRPRFGRCSRQTLRANRRPAIAASRSRATSRQRT